MRQSVQAEDETPVSKTRPSPAKPSSRRSPASGRRGRRSGSCGRRGAICRNIARSARRAAASSTSATRPRSRSRRRCSRSAASASTRRSSSPTFSSSPTRSGRRVTFETGEGPRLDPIGDAAGLATLRDEPDWAKLAPVFETLDRLKTALPGDVALIGFCGAPWTVASYMIAGRGTPDQAPARLFAYRDPKLFAALIDRLVDASAAYLLRQIAAGAEAVQIFDSWAGVLPPAEFERWCVAPIAALVAKVQARGAAGADHRLPARRGDAARQIRRHAGRRRDRPRHHRRARGRRGGAAGGRSRCRAISIRWRWSPAAPALDAGDRPRARRVRRPRAYLQSRPRHPAGDADRPCRAARAAGARAMTAAIRRLSTTRASPTRRPGSRRFRRKIVAAMEALEREFAGGDPAREPGRFVDRTVDAHRRERRARRRRPDGDAARAAVREDGRRIARPCTAPFRRNSRSRFRARRTTRASGRRASRSSPIPGARMSRPCT